MHTHVFFIGAVTVTGKSKAFFGGIRRYWLKSRPPISHPRSRMSNTNVPMTPRTHGNFPAPPQPPAVTNPATVAMQNDAQRTRFAELRDQVAAMDLPVDARLGLQRAAHVEAITGLEEIDPDFTFATCTVKIISTPCASGAQLGAEFNNFTSPTMKLYDELVMKLYDIVKSWFINLPTTNPTISASDAAASFKEWFPERGGVQHSDGHSLAASARERERETYP